MERLQNFINGKYVDPVDGHWIDNYNPSTGEVSHQVAASNAKDIEAAYQAARLALLKWSAMSIEQRSQKLIAIADIIDQEFELLTRAEAMDNGKPLSLAEAVDIPRASANLDSLVRPSPNSPQMHMRTRPQIQ